MSDIRLVIYRTNMTKLAVVQAPLELSWQMKEGDLPNIDVTLTDHFASHKVVPAPCFGAIEVLRTGETGWSEPLNARGYLSSQDWDRVDSTGRRVVHFTGMQGLLAKACVGLTGRAASGNREFNGRTVGSVLVTLLQDAKSRKLIPAVSWNFTATRTSAGDAWPASTVITRSYSPSVTLRTVLEDLVKERIIKVWWDGAVLNVVPWSAGKNRTVGDAPVYIRDAPLKGSPDKESWTELASQAVVLGDGKLWKAKTNPAAHVGYGGTEVYVSGSGVSSLSDADPLLDAALARGAQPTRTFTRDWVHDPAVNQPLPLVDFFPGESVYVDTADYRRVTMPVAHARVSRDKSGQISASAVLGEIVDDPLTRTTKELRHRTNDLKPGTPGMPQMPVKPEHLAGPLDQNQVSSLPADLAGIKNRLAALEAGAGDGAGGGTGIETMSAVRHGTNSMGTRPDRAVAVYWIGTAAPKRSTTGDLWLPI